MKQNVESVIASGKRNVCIDLSQLDYLYSDAINALIVINRRMLDVMGRLSLLSPQPSVMEILKKSGMHNILKIFQNEAELLRTSEELSGMVQAGPVFQAPSRPPSEFDDLRNEIGSAFEAPSPVAEMPQPPRRQPAPAQEFYPQQPTPPPVQPAIPQRPAAFVPPAQPQFTPPPPPAGPAPRYAPPPVRPFEAKPAARAYTPPPPPKPAPMQTGGETRRMPPVMEPPAGRPPQPPMAVEEDLDQFEATLEKKAPAGRAKRDRFDEDYLDDVPKKKSLAPVLAVLVVLVVLAGGGFFAYTAFFQKKPGPAKPPVSEVQQPPQEKVVPQVPVETAQPEKPAEEPAKKAEPAVKEVPQRPQQSAAQRVAAAERAAAAEKAAKVSAAKRAAAAKKAAAARVAARAAAAKAAAEEAKKRALAKQAEEERVVKRTPPSKIEVIEDEEPPSRSSTRTSKPEPAEEPAAPTGEAASVFIASIPPVADIYMDGKLVGKTNISEIKVTAGTHTLRFVKGDKEVTKQQTFQPGKNPSMMVRIQ